MYHYYGEYPDILVPGAPVDLKDIGLLGEFQNTPSVSGAVSQFESMIRNMAKQKRFSLDCDKNKSITFSFSGPKANIITNVTQQIFPIGHSTFFRSASVTVSASDCVCCNGKQYPSRYSYEANLTFAIHDRFVNPLKTNGIGVNGNAGGIPYDINASWTETIHGEGKLPIPCS